MKRLRGRGTLEFLIVVLVFGMLAAVLLDRLVGIERAAERSAVDLAVRNMRVGLQLAIGERIMQGREDRMGEVLDLNPLDFLGRPADAQAESGDGRRGSWLFQPVDRTLVYRPRQPEAFSGRTELRWRIAAYRAAGNRIVGIRLENASD